MTADLPRPTRTATPVTSLVQLTEHLAEDPGALVHAVLTHGEHLVTASALVPAHLDLLVGFRAPTDWHGVAVVAHGATVAVVDGRGDDTPADAPAWTGDPLVVAVAVTRDGDVAATSAGPRARWSGCGAHEVGGFVVDLCRRVLGLDCPPEPRSPADLALVQWLSLLLDLAADPTTCDLVGSWADVAALHPAWDGDDLPESLGEAAQRLGRRWTWEALRSGTERGELHIEGVTPEVAGWMDAPFLARWLLGTHRTPAELVDDLRLFLRPEVHHGVRRLVTACDG